MDRYEWLMQNQTNMVHAVEQAFWEYRTVPEDDLVQHRPGSEAWHGIQRRRADKRRNERRRVQDRDRNAKRKASARGLHGQSLKCGYTWSQVLSWHQFNWAAALEYWDAWRQWERENPQQAQNAYPAPHPYAQHYGHQDDYADPYANGHQHGNAPGYYVQPVQRPNYGFPPPPPIEETTGIHDSRTDLNWEERMDRVLIWFESRMAWEIYHEGLRPGDDPRNRY